MLINYKYYNLTKYTLFFKSRLLFPLFMLLSCYLTSCDNKTGARPNLLDSTDWTIHPDQISHKFEVLFLDSNWTKAKLIAGRGRTYNSRMETLIDGELRLDLYAQNSTIVTTWLTADSARIDDRTGDMLARGNVVVFSDSSQTTLETSLLQWVQADNKFYSTEFVRITSPEELIEGYGFESDKNLINYKIFKVSGVKR